MSGVVDVDFVPVLTTVAHVREHLSPGWREHLSTGGGLTGAGYSVPAAPYRMPASLGDEDPVARARRLLDARGVTRAIVDPGHAPGISGISNVVMAAEIARASNDWLLERWPSADERLRIAIVVSPRDGQLAAAEVARLGGDSRVAQVVMAFPPVLLGDRSLHPLYDAAAGAGLPIMLVAGGGFAGANAGPSPVGHPTSLWEYRIASAYTAIAHLASIVSEGVMERFASLRLVMSGFGVAWLPSLLWRMDTEFDAAAPSERPRRLGLRPSEVIREYVRFTTVGLERPPDVAALRTVLAPIGGDELLLFGSGQSDDVVPWELGAFGDAVGSDTAAAWFPPPPENV